MRFRNTFLIIGSVLVVALLLISDPDGGFVQQLPFGSTTLSDLIILVRSVLYVGLLHLSRKALFDYIDLEQLFKSAHRTPEGSGKVFVGIGLAMIAIAIVIHAAVG